MTVKERLHGMIDRLPESELGAIEEYLNRFCGEHDPVLKAFMEAPEVDEPLSDEDIRAIEEAEEEIARGEYVSWEEVRAEMNGET